MEAKADNFEVAIVGAGVTGTALAYVLAKYSDVKRIIIIEKCGSVAEISSHASHNSQTLHFGDIETNYSVEKARAVKAAAEMVVKYAGGADSRDFLKPVQKMVLGVGAEEVEVLKKRFEDIRGLFPETRLIDRDELARVEPKVVEGRDPQVPLIAIYNERGFMVDFGALARSFVSRAAAILNDGLEVRLGTAVASVARVPDGFELATSGGTVRAGAVVVASGAHSLRFAHAMGLGKELTLLPMAGDFFSAPNLLRGKVYTVQKKQLPFAAVHGDPDFSDAAATRFGPIARAVPLLEPGRWRTVADFFRVFRPDRDTLISIYKVNSDPVVLSFILKHLSYYIPFVGKYFFLSDGRKIIPTLSPKGLYFDRKRGGVRPQVVHKPSHTLQMGDAKIVGDGIIFNVTPSPGASVCLRNAVEDARTLVSFFKGRFHLDEDSLRRDLL